MYNYVSSKESAVAYWESTPTDQPWLLNGFQGTWAFSDYSLIPQPILEFLHEYYNKQLGDLRKNHIKTIKLNEINDLLNKVWDGPGSMPKIAAMTHDIRIARLSSNSDDTTDPLKGYDTPTIESNLGENVVDRLEK